MTNRDDFIQQELWPILGEYAEDFDCEAICMDVTEFDPVKGYVWRDGMDPDEFWRIVSEHDVADID